MVQFQAWSQLGGEGGWGGVPFLAFFQWSLGRGGGWVLLQPGLVSEGTFLLVSLQGTYTTLISLCPWPRAEFCHTEKCLTGEAQACGLGNDLSPLARDAVGMVSSLTSRLAGQFLS